MDIGSELRRARLARRLSLDDIAHATKISPSVLRSLENNAFAKVPGGLFARGYLRAYATHVGLDPEPIVAAYRETFDPPAAAVPGADTAGANFGHGDPRWTVEESDANSRHSEILQFAVILVVAFVYLASLRHPKTAPDLASGEAAALSTAPAATTPTVPPSEPQAVGTSGSTPTAKPLAIEIHPSAECWVDVTADGTHVISRLMNAGDRQSFVVRDALTMRIGDPAAFAFSIDGAAGRSLGAPRHPVTVRINRANYRTLLDVRPAG
jgi:cytoskeleton protein RodZ